MIFRGFSIDYGPFCCFNACFNCERFFIFPFSRMRWAGSFFFVAYYLVPEVEQG